MPTGEHPRRAAADESIQVRNQRQERRLSGITRRAHDVGREGVATHAHLVAAGVSLSTVSYRIRPNGRWQRLLPGVVLMHSGTPTWREKLLGALGYAGEEAVLTGLAALQLYGLRTARTSTVHLLVPHRQRRQGHGYVMVERTRRLPDASKLVFVEGLAVAPLARAVVDACRRMANRNAVRNLVSDAVQNHGLRIEDLQRELRSSARQRTALAQAVLEEMDAGVRFAAEARARELIARHDLPQPLFNVDVLTSCGRVIVRPDGYFPQLACGYEIDSRRWHLSPDAYEATTRRRGYAARFGVLLLSVTPSRVFDDPDGFLADLQGLLGIARERQVPNGLVVRHRSC